MISLRKFGIGNNGGTYGDGDSDVPNDTPSSLMGSFKKGGRVKKTGPYKLHEGETVIPALRSIRIQIHRGPKGEATGFTVHHEGMPRATKSAAFMEESAESHPFGIDQHDEMMDHIDQHVAGQRGG